MTPAAITPAGRAVSKNRSPASAPGRPAATRSSRPAPAAASHPASATAVPGHRRRLRPQSAPKSPRRVSGPTRGRLAGTASPRTRSDTRRSPSRSASPPLGTRALAFARALPDHPLLDRLIRGRAWIPLLGVMLAGIVAMQVEVLKLGTSMGRSIERGATLQARNDQLRMTVAALDADQRIEHLAEARGMIMPAPDTVGFLSSHSRAIVHSAIANIHAPDAAGFLALSTSNGGVATTASSQAAISGSSTYASMQTASAVSGSTPASSDSSPATSSTSQSSSQTDTASRGASSTSSTSSNAATAQSAPTTATQAGTTSSGQSTATGAGTTPTGTTPAGTVPSQSSTSSSGGAGIPVGG